MSRQPDIVCRRRGRDEINTDTPDRVKIDPLKILQNNPIDPAKIWRLAIVDFNNIGVNTGLDLIEDDKFFPIALLSQNNLGLLRQRLSTVKEIPDFTKLRLDQFNAFKKQITGAPGAVIFYNLSDANNYGYSQFAKQVTALVWSWAEEDE